MDPCFLFEEPRPPEKYGDSIESINRQLQGGWFLDASIFKPIKLKKASRSKTISDFGRLIALDKTGRRKIK
jgi:hypothetical protein